MNTVAEAIETITVREAQLRLAQSEAAVALKWVMNTPADKARTRLRFGPGPTCEPLARMLDRALAQAEEAGVEADQLVLNRARVVQAEHIIRIRRKAHGLADWISSPTSDITLVLAPPGLAPEIDIDSASPAPGVADTPSWTPAPETAAESEIRQALLTVLDPDLGVNIVDLGFVRQVRLDDAGHATITMTLTSPACPLAKVMTDQMRTILAERNTEFTVDWMWQPSWRPADITPSGREQLAAIGFNKF
ncbi:iron-sulfur cluster assembly protein [Bordetella genomosp. 12]|uniref:50S ribosomal protein L22 n=1 Tax=Bordetella genomosp. 12 TaxID=463035 RepID=A0A261VUZ2_9BORD|nr:iron-sulfur cluster assembly protein [Bordetella genomosp. 12]OZI77103.1 hypothetical protein CAL22_00680 [Bordetella genomosp. 12]